MKESQAEHTSPNPEGQIRPTGKSGRKRIGDFFGIGAIVGIGIGAIGGYLYWYYIGCRSGSCPINSNPYISTLYGAVIGYLIGDIFKKKVKKVEKAGSEG